MKRIAFIPARGGSKRLPRKNILEFSGRPLLAYTIEAALQSGLFETVAVSTEDREIAAVAEGAGAEVVDRPPALASDTATVNDTALAALEDFERKGRRWDQLCCLYATAPLRRAEDIKSMYRLLDPPRVSFVIAVTSFPFPPHQALVVDGEGLLRFQWPELGAKRASALPRFVVDNGSTYWADVGAYRAQRTFYGTGLRGYEMPLARSIDIDTAEQFELALAIKNHLPAEHVS